MEADTSLVPITAVPPTAGHISSFLSYIRRSVADDAAATAASAAETLVTPPSPDVNVDADGGATANVGVADATVDGYDAAVNDFSPPGTDDATMPTATSSSKARRKRQRLDPAGPAHAARRTAFLAVARPDATGITYPDGATATSAVGTTGVTTAANDAVDTVDAAATSPTNARRRRRRSNPAGPAHAARRTTFLAGERHDATDTT
jgi:hypothetical protein